MDRPLLVLFYQYFDEYEICRYIYYNRHSCVCVCVWQLYPTFEGEYQINEDLCFGTSFYYLCWKIITLIISIENMHILAVLIVKNCPLWLYLFCGTFPSIL